jgi:hypothetical protein
MTDNQMEVVLSGRISEVNSILAAKGVQLEFVRKIHTLTHNKKRIWSLSMISDGTHDQKILQETEYMAEVEGFLNALQVVAEGKIPEVLMANENNS